MQSDGNLVPQSQIDPSQILADRQLRQLAWQLLYQYGADLVLNGHDHLYARYRPLDPSGYDLKKGIREFIVDTGGETLDPVVTTNTTAADPTGNPNFT